MKKVTKYLVSILLSLSAATSSAEFYDGNKIMEWIRDAESESSYFSRGLLSGYVAGVVDSNLEFLRKEKLVCMPQNVNMGQLRAVTIKYFKSNPEKWALPGDVLVVYALQSAFPCKK